LPKEFPPDSTVRWYLGLWEWDGTLLRIHDALYAESRALAGRNVEPSLGIIDSQSARGAEKGGRRPIRRAEPVLGRAFGPTRGTRARRSRAASAISS